MDQQVTQVCENCLKSFPESKMATHFGYCRRNIKKCEKCLQMYDINFLQDHEQEFHKLQKCNYCKKQFQPHDIKNHELNCQAKTKFCQYCDLDVPLKQYSIHIKACEARTKPCEKCRKPISNKDYLGHLVSCPGYIQESISSNSSSSNQYSNYSQYVQNHQKNRNNIKAENKQEIPKTYQDTNKHQKKTETYNANYANINYKERKPDIPVYENSNTYGVKKLAPKQQIQTKEEIKYSNREQNKNVNKQGIKDGVGAVRDIKGNYNNPIPTTKNKFDNYGSSNNPITIEYKNKNDSNKIPIGNINGNQPQYKKIQEKNNQKIVNPLYDYNRNKQIINQPEENNKYKNIGIKKNAKIQNQKQPRRKEEIANFNKKNEIGSKKDIPTFSNQNKKQEYKNISNNFYPEEKFQQEIYQHQYLNDYNPIHNDFQIQGEDPQLQKAIMMSMGGNSLTNNSSQGYKSPIRGTKKAQRIDDVKPQQLDHMNQSFYEKQRAIYDQFQKKKKK